MTSSSLDATRRLAERVLDGEVVFFVGSGFSVDSEGNTASRLVGRLLAALLGMGSALSDATGASEAATLLERLVVIFGLTSAAPSEKTEPATRPAHYMTKANLERLAREYYNFNDWSVSALRVLSGELLSSPARDELASRSGQLGNFLLGLVGDAVALEPLDCTVLDRFQDPTARGKALFLDIMGFADPVVMAGRPRDPDEVSLAHSYAGRLRPRHHALARLAREGLAPALVTTNYDLLLEGAYRLAGFVEGDMTVAPAGVEANSLARFSRIAGAEHFFSRGRGYRTALLLKIHGCAEEYRRARDRRITELRDENSPGGAAAGPDAWAAYLPALVFTYREIQTWRSDAWSRDLIRTLLRTHAVALCGYSGADPVMHSTFREVYEEQALTRQAPLPGGPNGARSPENASVFSFGFSEKREFHGFELLRAATAAAGLETARLADHPNYIQFERSTGFPAIDDHFRWLMHCVVREQQKRGLRSSLRRLMPRLLRRPCRDRELDILDGLLEARIEEERRMVAVAGDPASALPAMARKQRLDEAVGWTWHFVPGLLRELAAADAVGAHAGAGYMVRRSRTPTHYHPVSEHPTWAAWAVIVEFAIRSLVEGLGGSAGPTPEESRHAAVSFSNGASDLCPLALCVRMEGFDRPNLGASRSVLADASALTGAFRRVTYWEFADEDVPWPQKQKDRCPKLEDMWTWALGTNRPTVEQARNHLGVEA